MDEGLLRLVGWRAGISRADAEYFNPPDNFSRVATARRHKTCPTLTQIRTVLDTMPAKTEIERRDRALVAFTILTGARDQAIVSFKLKHIDVEHELLEQDDRQVLTKRAKTFTTWFFPIGDAVQQIVVERVTFLRAEKGFGPEDPIFPKARVEMGPDLSLRGKTVFNARIGSVPKGRFAIFQSALVPQHARPACL